MKLRYWCLSLGTTLQFSLAHLSVALLLSVHLPQLLQVSDRASGFDETFLCAFCVGRVGRLGQIQELVPLLAPEADPVQMLPHGGHHFVIVTLYLSMMTDMVRGEGRREEDVIFKRIAKTDKKSNLLSKSNRFFGVCWSFKCKKKRKKKGFFFQTETHRCIVQHVTWITLKCLSTAVPASLPAMKQTHRG